MIKKIVQNTTALTLLGLILANVCILYGFHSSWLVQIFLAGFVLIIPGYLLLPLLTPKKIPLLLALSMSVVLSIFILMVAGFFVNVVLPYAGVLHPLAVLPLLITFDVVVVSLSVLFHLFECDSPIQRVAYNTFTKAIMLAASSLVPLSILGAISLNNQGTNFFTMMALCLMAVLILVCSMNYRRMYEDGVVWTLLCMAIALLLMSSMRGWAITGHDVLREYHVMELAAQNSRWQIQAFRDPYNACLSITILPTFLQRLIGSSDVNIFKLVMQFIGGLTVIPLYYLVRRFTKSIVAFLAGVFYVTFPTYMVDMSMLNRQSIAFLFFFTFIYVLLTRHFFTGKQRSIMLYSLGLGVIISHYSTSYVAVGILCTAFVIDLVTRWLVKNRYTKKIMSILPNERIYHDKKLMSFSLVIFMLIACIVWSGPITGTSKGITTTIRKISQAVLHPLNQDDAGPGAAKYSIGQSKVVTKDTLFSNYIDEQKRDYAKSTDVPNLYSLNEINKYPSYPVDEPTVPLSPVGKTIESFSHLSLNASFGATKQIYAKGIQGLLLIGVIGIFIGLRFRSAITLHLPSEYHALMIAAVLLIVMQTILPQDAIDYGLLRLLQQNFIVLALPIILGFLVITQLIMKRFYLRMQSLSIMLVVFFLILGGFIPQLIGGSRPLLALNNNGFYYDAYFSHETELSGFKWVRGNISNMSIIQADRFSTAVKLLAYSDKASGVDLIPYAIKKNAYVILGANNTQGSVVSFVDGEALYFKFQTQFLDSNKDKIYANKGFGVYR